MEHFPGSQLAHYRSNKTNIFLHIHKKYVLAISEYYWLSTNQGSEKQPVDSLFYHVNIFLRNLFLQTDTDTFVIVKFLFLLALTQINDTYNKLIATSF